VEKCKEKGAIVESLIIDVRSSEFQKSLQDVNSRHEIDMVIANAGVSYDTLGVEQSFEDKVHTIFDVNVLGVINTITPFLSTFKKRRSGQIVLMGSLAGVFSAPRQAAYNSSKAAVYRFGRDLRSIMKQYHVQVNTVVPGFVKSEMTRSLQQQGYKLPFLMEPSESASHIKRELEVDVGLIGYPLPLYLSSISMLGVSPFVLERILDILSPFISMDYDKCG
jgi:short-subunit dehydrogenase